MMHVKVNCLCAVSTLCCNVQNGGTDKQCISFIAQNVISSVCVNTVLSVLVKSHAVCYMCNETYYGNAVTRNVLEISANYMEGLERLFSVHIALHVVA